MTLIAGFIKDGCPILLGDLLISNTNDSNTVLILPTLGRISSLDFRKGEFRPSQLFQKVNLLNSKTAIAWAGNLLEAKEFMGQLLGASSQYNLSQELIFDIYDDLAPKDLSIIGVLRGEEFPQIFAKNTFQVNVSDLNFRWFQASGTGYSSLLKIIPKLQPAAVSGTINKLESAISSAIQISSSLLELEITTAQPLNELFGAGYEILHPLRENLAKFEDLTYYFWQAEEIDSDKWHILPFLVMKYSYFGDILIIRSIRLFPGEQANTVKIASDELHVINPIYRIIKEDELIGYVPAFLASKFTCNIVLCKKLDNKMGIHKIFGRNNNQLTPIIWNNEFRPNEGKLSPAFLDEAILKINSLFL